MFVNFQEAAAAASSAGSLLPPELQAVLDLTGCAAVVVAIVLFLRHLRFERESRDKERTEFLAALKTQTESCSAENDKMLKMIERIEGKFADTVSLLVAQIK